MKYAIYATIYLFSIGAACGLGYGMALKRSEMGLESLHARIEYLELSGPCEPVYSASWPLFECSARLSWPPYKCEVGVGRVADTDRSKVLAKVVGVGMRPGLTWTESRGRKERVSKIVWTPTVE